MVQVRVSKLIDAPVETTWETVRPFDSVVEWLPWVESGYIEEGKKPDQVGAVRFLQFTDGESYRSKLLSLSDTDRFREYTILAGDMDLREYRGRLELFECTGSNRALAVWSNRFTTNMAEKDEVVNRLEELYEAGLTSLNEILSS